MSSISEILKSTLPDSAVRLVKLILLENGVDANAPDSVAARQQIVEILRNEELPESSLSFISKALGFGDQKVASVAGPVGEKVAPQDLLQDLIDAHTYREVSKEGWFPELEVHSAAGEKILPEQAEKLRIALSAGAYLETESNKLNKVAYLRGRIEYVKLPPNAKVDHPMFAVEQCINEIVRINFLRRTVGDLAKSGVAQTTVLDSKTETAVEEWANKVTGAAYRSTKAKASVQGLWKGISRLFSISTLASEIPRLTNLQTVENRLKITNSPEKADIEAFSMKIANTPAAVPTSVKAISRLYGEIPFLPPKITLAELDNDIQAVGGYKAVRKELFALSKVSVAEKDLALAKVREMAERYGGYNATKKILSGAGDPMVRAGLERGIRSVGDIRSFTAKLESAYVGTLQTTTEQNRLRSISRLIPKYGSVVDLERGLFELTTKPQELAIPLAGVIPIVVASGGPSSLLAHAKTVTEKAVNAIPQALQAEIQPNGIGKALMPLKALFASVGLSKTHNMLPVISYLTKEDVANDVFDVHVLDDPYGLDALCSIDVKLKSAKEKEQSLVSDHLGVGPSREKLLADAMKTGGYLPKEVGNVVRTLSSHPSMWDRLPVPSLASSGELKDLSKQLALPIRDIGDVVNLANAATLSASKFGDTPSSIATLGDTYSRLGRTLSPKFADAIDPTGKPGLFSTYAVGAPLAGIDSIGTNLAPNLTMPGLAGYSPALISALRDHQYPFTPVRPTKEGKFPMLAGLGGLGSLVGGSKASQIAYPDSVLTGPFGSAYSNIAGFGRMSENAGLAGVSPSIAGLPRGAVPKSLLSKLAGMGLKGGVPAMLAKNMIMPRTSGPGFLQQARRFAGVAGNEVAGGAAAGAMAGASLGSSIAWGAIVAGVKTGWVQALKVPGRVQGFLSNRIQDVYYAIGILPSLTNAISGVSTGVNPFDIKTELGKWMTWAINDAVTRAQHYATMAMTLEEGQANAIANALTNVSGWLSGSTRFSGAIAFLNSTTNLIFGFEQVINTLSSSDGIKSLASLSSLGSTIASIGATFGAKVLGMKPLEKIVGFMNNVLGRFWKITLGIKKLVEEPGKFIGETAKSLSLAGAGKVIGGIFRAISRNLFGASAKAGAKALVLGGPKVWLVVGGIALIIVVVCIGASAVSSVVGNIGVVMGGMGGPSGGAIYPPQVFSVSVSIEEPLVLMPPEDGYVKSLTYLLSVKYTGSSETYRINTITGKLTGFDSSKNPGVALSMTPEASGYSLTIPAFNDNAIDYAIENSSFFGADHPSTDPFDVQLGINAVFPLTIDNYLSGAEGTMNMCNVIELTGQVDGEVTTAIGSICISPYGEIVDNVQCPFRIASDPIQCTQGSYSNSGWSHHGENAIDLRVKSIVSPVEGEVVDFKEMDYCHGEQTALQMAGGYVRIKGYDGNTYTFYHIVPADSVKRIGLNVVPGTPVGAVWFPPKPFDADTFNNDCWTGWHVHASISPAEDSKVECVYRERFSCNIGTCPCGSGVICGSSCDIP